MKIHGLELPEYIAYVLFADSIADLVEHDYPEFADEMFKPGKDMLDGVNDFFKSKKIDPKIYIDERPAMVLIQNVNKFWDGKLTVDDLARFDKDAITVLTLQARGDDIAIDNDKRVADFLKNNKVDAPKVRDIDIDYDDRSAIGAIKALEAAKEHDRKKD